MARPDHRRLLAGIIALSLAGGATLAVVPGASAATTCRVTNLGTGVVRSSLQRAVNAASGGATLQVKGRCVGGSTLDKNLTIIGARTAATGAPILDGNHAQRVVWVRVGRQVSIKGLTIRDGLAEGDYPANSGGGIRNDGTLTLTNVIVRNNEAHNGGGVSTAGRLIVKGATQIAYNDARQHNGGGVDVDTTDRPASLILDDSSSIHHNTAAVGGGVNIWVGTMAMNDVSSVHHNTADFGAGIGVQGHLVMNGSSTVRNNTVRTGAYGGGVEIVEGDGVSAPTFTMKGLSRVRNNTAGASGAGVLTWPDCGLDPVLTGVTLTRVVDNAPTNKVIATDC